MPKLAQFLFPFEGLSARKFNEPRTCIFRKLATFPFCKPNIFQSNIVSMARQKSVERGGQSILGPLLVVFSKMCYKVPFFMGCDEKISCNTEIYFMVRFRGAKKWARKTWTLKRDQHQSCGIESSWLISDVALGVFRRPRPDLWTKWYLASVSTVRAISRTHVITYERPQQTEKCLRFCEAIASLVWIALPVLVVFRLLFQAFSAQMFFSVNKIRDWLPYTSAVASFSLIKRRRFIPF